MNSKPQLMTWEYTTTADANVRYLLARDLEDALYSAAELSGGTSKLKNLRRADEWQ